MNPEGIQQSAVIAGIIISNIGALAAAYVSIRVSVAKLETEVSNLKDDLKNLGDLYRAVKKEP
jgi:hypothetical protein